MGLRALLVGLAGLVVLGLPAGASADGVCPNEALREAQSSAFLGDCRAYELVSPAEKGGVDIAATPERTRAALDGNAVQYLSLGGFGDAHGTDAIGTEYIAERGADGWASHGITPPQRPPVFLGPSSLYAGDLSGDLSTGVFYALSPLTSDPDVANVRNLYLRRDLLDAGAGSYQLLSGCPGCEAPLPVPPFATFVADPALAGASRDFSHVIFESPENLTADASGTGKKLYESVGGVVRLAGILPDSACGSLPCPAETSIAGAGASGRGSVSMSTRGAISEDGSRIVFTAGPFTPAGVALAPREVPNIEGLGGVLYMREGGVRTVQLNASERLVAESPLPAVFEVATSDDSRVFFATRENLTEDAAGTKSKIYMYATDAPAGHHLTLISRSYEPTESYGMYVVGVSNDGRYVYFFNEEKASAVQPNLNLVEGQVNIPGFRQLYVWHDGEVRYINAGELLSFPEVAWGEFGIGPGTEARVSLNGKTIAFVSLNPGAAEAAGYDNHGEACLFSGVDPCNEVYVYSFDSDRVVCVSCDAGGAAPLGNAGIGIPSSDAAKSTDSHTSHLSRAVVDDGVRVFFDSPDPLVPGDVNGRMDVYEYDVTSGALHLISGGRSSSDSLFLDASANGSDVFFATSERLVGGDVDGNRDVYDARVDGGLAAQVVVPVAGCEGDACQGGLSVPGVLGVPGSVGVVGAGNLPPVPVVKGKLKAKAKKAKPKKKRRSRRRRGRRGRVSVKGAHRRVGR